VHGEIGLETALKVTKGASPGSETVLDGEVLEQISLDMPNQTLSRTQVVGHKIIDLIVAVGLQPSKGEARRLVKNGGVYINNTKIIDENLKVEEADLIDGRLLLIAAGKKNKILVRVQ